MRIIGGHDYYDKGLAFGADPDIVFVRAKSRLLKEDFLPAPRLHMDLHELTDSGDNWRSYRPYSDFTLKPMVVYVAGVRHTGIRVIHRRSAAGWITVHFWTHDKLEDYLNSYGATLERFGPRYKRRRYSGGNDPLALHFNQNGTVGERQICIDNSVAVATLEVPDDRREPCRWLVNGDNLKDYEFYRVMDAYRCYQELAMFVGGVLPRAGNNMVEISDKSRIAKHGFDKWSFRRLPQG